MENPSSFTEIHYPVCRVRLWLVESALCNEGLALSSQCHRANLLVSKGRREPLLLSGDYWQQLCVVLIQHLGECPVFSSRRVSKSFRIRLPFRARGGRRTVSSASGSTGARP